MHVTICKLGKIVVPNPPGLSALPCHFRFLLFRPDASLPTLPPSAFPPKNRLTLVNIAGRDRKPRICRCHRCCLNIARKLLVRFVSVRNLRPFSNRCVSAQNDFRSSLSVRDANDALRVTRFARHPPPKLRNGQQSTSINFSHIEVLLCFIVSNFCMFTFASRFK